MCADAARRVLRHFRDWHRAAIAKRAKAGSMRVRRAAQAVARVGMRARANELAMRANARAAAEMPGIKWDAGEELERLSVLL